MDPLALAANESDLRLAKVVIKGAKALLAQQAADMQLDFQVCCCPGLGHGNTSKPSLQL